MFKLSTNNTINNNNFCSCQDSLVLVEMHEDLIHKPWHNFLAHGSSLRLNKDSLSCQLRKRHLTEAIQVAL